jgi:predicted transcriptional regulator of viral defense system
MQSTLDRLYDLAEPQAGYFTTAQARDLSISRQELYYLRQSGDLLQAAHGIQRLSRFPVSPHEDIVVACLWVGPDCVASHETALVVYGLGEAMPATIHVTVRRAFRGRRKGVTVHRGMFDADEATHRDGVPVTAPLRTIADVAKRDPSGAGVALRDALERGIVRRNKLSDAASRYPEVQSVFVQDR